MFDLKAGAAEQVAGALLRAVLVSLATNGTAPGLEAYAADTRTVNRLERSPGAGQPAAAFQAEPHFKQDLCDSLLALGFDARFWWIN